MTSPWHALCITALLLTSTACGDEAPQTVPATDAAPTADVAEAASAPDTTLAQAGGQAPPAGLELTPPPPKPVENLKEKVSYMIGRGFGQDMKQRNPDLTVDFASARSGVNDAMGEQADQKLSYAIGSDGLGGVNGQWGDGRLGNGGETISLVAADGAMIRQFRYDDEGTWPERADGVGSMTAQRAP